MPAPLSPETRKAILKHIRYPDQYNLTEMNVPAYNKTYLNALFIEELDSHSPESDEYQLLAQKWRNAKNFLMRQRQSYTQGMALLVLKHFRNVFPDTEPAFLRKFFPFNLRSYLFKEKLINLQEALGNVSQMPVYSNPYSYELHEYGQMIDNTDNSINVTYHELFSFIKSNRKYFINKDNYVDLNTPQERISFLWVATMMMVNPQKLVGEQPCLTLIPKEDKAVIDKVQPQIEYLANFTGKTVSLYLNDVYAFLDEQLTDLKSKVTSGEINPQTNMMSHIHNENSGILMALKIVARHAPDNEKTKLLQEKFIKRHADVDELFKQAWLSQHDLKHKVDGTSYPFFNRYEVQPLNNYFRHTDFKTDVYQEIQKERNNLIWDITHLPVEQYLDFDFKQLESDSKKLSRMVEHIISEAAKHFPENTRYTNEPIYRGIGLYASKKNFITLFLQIGEQLSKLEHNVTVDASCLFRGIGEKQREWINEHHLFALLDNLNTTKIKFDGFNPDDMANAKNWFSLYKDTYRSSLPNPDEEKENLLETIFVSLAKSKYHEWIDTNFLKDNFQAFQQMYHSLLKDNPNSVYLDQLNGRVQDAFALERLTKPDDASQVKRNKKLKV